MTLETVVIIIAVAGSILILISRNRPSTQGAENTLDETLYASGASYAERSALARQTEVLVEDRALRMLLDIDSQATTVEESIGLIRQMMNGVLPEYAEPFVECGAGSVIYHMLNVRRYFGEPLPADITGRLALTPIS